MKLQCPYCDAMFDDTLTHCPNCGAASEGVVRTEKSQPLTIEQLQKWYADRGLPPYKTTRFFIGENHKGPRAFGIYQDEHTGNFVVYKNLASGERKIRYEGTDEAYAVNELYMRLKQEIIQQKRNALDQKSGASNTQKKSGGVLSFVQNHVRQIIIVLAILIFGSGFVSWLKATPSKGYYTYNNTTYYHAAVSDDLDDWYYFDTDADSWEQVSDTLPEELTKDSTASDFYATSTWNPTTQEGDFAPVPFTVSEYASQYETDENKADDATWNNDNDDTDYDWDTNDTWDNDTTDWDTDW